MFTNTATTGSGYGYPNLTLENLQKMIEELPEPPKIYAMDYTMVVNECLSDNTIVISKDLAIRLGMWE